MHPRAWYCAQGWRLTVKAVTGLASIRSSLVPVRTNFTATVQGLAVHCHRMYKKIRFLLGVYILQVLLFWCFTPLLKMLSHIWWHWASWVPYGIKVPEYFTTLMNLEILTDPQKLCESKVHEWTPYNFESKYVQNLLNRRCHFLAFGVLRLSC